VHGGFSAQDQLLDDLSERSTLLVLDNFEHLVDRWPERAAVIFTFGVQRRESASTRRSGITLASRRPRENPERSRRRCATMRNVPKSVLIVDDHQPFRAVARALLEGAGYIVAGEASDAAEALAAVATSHPDAVLLDVQLPDRDGFAVAEALAGAGGPAVVLISTRDADDYGRRIETSGARGFIAKSKLSAAAFTAMLEQ
jgi:CheY-like chemotaxis protein